jgi:hypothetical protein
LKDPLICSFLPYFVGYYLLQELLSNCSKQYAGV